MTWMIIIHLDAYESRKPMVTAATYTRDSWNIAVVRTPKGPHLRKCNPFCMICAKHTQMGTPMRAGLVDLDMCIEQYGVFGPLVFILANLGRVMEIPLPGCLGIITKAIAFSILWMNCLTKNIHSLPLKKTQMSFWLFLVCNESPCNEPPPYPHNTCAGLFGIGCTWF